MKPNFIVFQGISPEPKSGHPGGVWLFLRRGETRRRSSGGGDVAGEDVSIGVLVAVPVYDVSVGEPPGGAGVRRDGRGRHRAPPEPERHRDALGVVNQTLVRVSGRAGFIVLIVGTLKKESKKERLIKFYLLATGYKIV